NLRPKMFMMTATSTRVAVTLTVLLALAAPARAQSAEAETLFREGKRLLKKGDIAEACNKFDASERLEPTAGTELNLADCREKNGQLATAWALFVKAASVAKHAGGGKREVEARRRAAALEARLVYLTITVTQRIDGLVIKRNATPIDPALWDQRVPVDPDDYTISVEAPGHQPWRTTVVVKTRSKQVDVPVLDKELEPRPSPRAPEPVAAAPVETRVTPAMVAPPSRLTGRRKLSVVLAGIGVVGLGAGIGFGLHAQSLADDADKVCPDTACNNADAVDQNHRARSNGLYANLGFIAGGGLLITGAVLWFTGAPKERDRVAIVPTIAGDRVGLSLAGGF
ncbi:MAG: hypothetical protein ABIY55_34700, partial [Kofleriaceae bacterium]